MPSTTTAEPTISPIESANSATAARPAESARPAAGRIAYLLADGGIPFFDSRKGGSIHARYLARAFAQEGWRVNVYVLRAGKSKRKGFDVRQIRAGKLTRWWLRRVLDGDGWKWIVPWQRRRAQPPNWMTAVGVLLWQRDFCRVVARRCRRRRQPDLLYARHSWLSFAYSRLRRRLGVPLALEVNAVLSIEKADRDQMAFSALTRRIEKTAFETADWILPVTVELKNQIEAFGIDPNKIFVTPNAVDLEWFRPVGAETASGENENSKLKTQNSGEGAADDGGAFLVGYVHSFKPYHGMAVLLDAAERLHGELPRLRLRVLGSGPEFAATERMIQEADLQEVVELTGTVHHDRVPDLLRGCDVAVAPYHGPYNLYGCPMKLYEYMALKLPIVAADWGDIPNTLTHGETALLHPPGDAEALAQRLLEVWRDPQAARRRAEQAYELVRRRTWRTTASEILARLDRS